MEIIYPALFLTKDDGLVYGMAKPIKTLLYTSLSSYKNCYVIDSNSYFHEIAEAKNLGWAFIRGYSLLYKGRNVKVRFEIIKSEKINLEKCKALLLDFLSQKDTPIKFWYNNLATKKIVYLIQSATTLKEIMNIFLEDVD